MAEKIFRRKCSNCIFVEKVNHTDVIRKFNRHGEQFTIHFIEQDLVCRIPADAKFNGSERGPMNFRNCLVARKFNCPLHQEI